MIYDQIFCRQNASVFDNAILEALYAYDYCNVIFIARLAEINRYSSRIINSSVITALQNFHMCGSFPITMSYNNSFILYDRYMINAYRYAKELNVSGWDINQSYLDFVQEYMKPPNNSQYGEMLWINPQMNYSESQSSRYYDEHAETLDMFLEFALAGINESAKYADDAWISTQSHWDGSIYGYRTSSGDVECEMGNFAQVISEYRNYRGDIPYFSRVIADLENKLLIEGFDSRGWGTVGVIQHASDNTQLRLGETLGNLLALQMFYPYFNNNAQSSFRDMLGTNSWQGLIASPLFDNNRFQWNNDTTFGFDSDASNVGLMTLFLSGVIPTTGNLAINASEERYPDYRTCFPTSQWQFNYQNKMIRIPVKAGTLSFIFGSRQVNENFGSDGVFEVYFADDWNRIVLVKKVANINTVSLQPVTLETIPKSYVTPKTYPTPTPRPNPTPTPTPNFQRNSTTPTISPTPTVDTTPTLTLPAQQSPIQKNDVALTISVIGGVSGLFGFVAFCYFFSVRRKSRVINQF